MLSSDVLPSFGKTKMPFDYYLDRDGYPCNAPPWAELFGINANTGDIVWRVPLGRIQGADGERHCEDRNGHQLGCAARHGRRSGVHRRHLDGQFRAFDSMTGKELWSASPGFNVPTTRSATAPPTASNTS